MSLSFPPVQAQQVHLTALERHPDGVRVRLTRTEYSGSALYGPALAALIPAAAPIRRLEYEVLPHREGVPQRRAVWLLEGDGGGDGWLTPDALPPEARAWAAQVLAPDAAARPVWQRRGGWAALLTWLGTELEAQGLQRLGVPQVLKDWGISFLARVQTGGGVVYLKAVPDFFLAEVAVTCALQHDLPGAAAPLLAADRARGLMLLRDAGEPLRNGASGQASGSPDAPTWTPEDSRALTRHLARVQRGAETLPLLLRLPDHGPEWVLGRLPDLFAGPLFLTGHRDGLTPEEERQLLTLRPRLEAALNRLADSPIPRTLGHGDLHGGNVLRRGTGFTLLDWSDASRTHPFLDGGPQYLVPEGGRAEAADTYLEAWAGLLPLPDLRALLRDGVLVGELYRALGYTEGVAPHVAADDHDWLSAHLYHFRALLRLADQG